MLEGLSALLRPPPPIRTDESNAFAQDTMARRIPAIIQESIALNPDYPASFKARLAVLRGEVQSGQVIRPLDGAMASDYQQWLAALRRQQELLDGELTWHNAEWFFAETYAYRCMLEAARYFESRRDPFAPKKAEELQGEGLWRLLERALLPAGDAESQLLQALSMALWANRIDLSYEAALERGTDMHPDDLLVDDSAQVLAYLKGSAAEGTIYIVADNAGSELAMDLALADCLLRHVSNRVVVYLKAHPTFVSDAVPQDLWNLLVAMERRGGRCADLARRLRDDWEAERLVCAPHAYWNSSAFLRDMPPQLRESVNQSRLLIIKGDANYRRAIGDCLWPPETPFADVMAFLDAPVLCLRTLKSDPIVGLPSAEFAQNLNRVDAQWRVNGKRGLIQFKPQTSKSQYVAVLG